MRLRSSLVLLSLLALVGAPIALAASSSLTIGAPESAIQAGSVVPLTVTLTAGDFLCQEERFFEVILDMTPSAGLDATLENTTVRLPVPPRSYFIEGYHATATVNLTLGSSDQPGTVAIIATFTAEEGMCFAPGGIQSSMANLSFEVQPGTAAATPPATVPPAVDEGAGGNSTLPADTNETDQTANKTRTPTPRTGGMVCGPDGNCGPIGEYDPGTVQESTDNDTPGPGVALVALAAVGVALAWRRRS